MSKRSEDSYIVHNVIPLLAKLGSEVVNSFETPTGLI